MEPIPMQQTNRREFLKAAGTTGAFLLAPGARVLGANEDVRVGVIGLGGKGSQHVKEFHRIPGVRVVAVCDADSSRLAARIRQFESQAPGQKMMGVTDFRRILDSDEVDAVVIATCNHWHALMSIYACQAGKDVYVEKPATHTIYEGRRLVEAAHAYGRIVQAGTQNRSDVGLLEFYPFLREGNIGKITMVRGIVYRDRNTIGKRETPLTPPPEVDYNLWLGPAQDLPMFRSRFHYDWHYIWNTGNGEIGNQGPHEADLICWTFDDNVLPTRILSLGGRFGWGDAGETPNMQFVLYDFAGTPVLYEVRTLWLAPDRKALPNYRGCRTGLVITCEGGTFIGGRGGGWLYDNDGNRVRQFKGDGGGGHTANFITAVRSRRESDLRAPIEKSHKSCMLVHTGNISYRLGQQRTPEELRERMSDDKDAVEVIGRYSEQLAAWNVDLTKEPWTLGATLTFDPVRERFAGTTLVDEANALLHRRDREPFVVPEKV
ncbi:MAG: Gfo/Idh/MocA family oxidoreductase [Lentisphaeria bacterium]|nr:Gfo/Idh/MocA family oxidoreductase [Lentisphaeria bacterium]